MLRSGPLERRLSARNDAADRGAGSRGVRVMTPKMRLAAVAALLLLLAPERACRATLFSYTGSLQTYTVTTTGTYSFTVYGAAGGPGFTSTGGFIAGGYGTEVTGDITLTAGTVLDIVVGGVGGLGIPNQNYGGGGGGGSFVFVQGATNPLMVAGGGGGGGASGAAGGNGTGTSGQDASGGGAGGTSGLGGTGYTGGGGTGWFSPGSGGFGGGGGLGKSNSFGGGSGSSGTNSGGYGGGGGGSGFVSSPASLAGGGGGGGYSGGGGGGSGGGGGGGSYVGSAFTNITLTANVSNVDGSVTINGPPAPASAPEPSTILIGGTVVAVGLCVAGWRRRRAGRAA